MAYEDAAVDVQAANERLAKMGINGNGLAEGRSNVPGIPLQGLDIDIKTGVVTERHRDLPARKTRSDFGTKRPKPEAPAPAQSGPLTEQQWARVNVYFDRVSQSAADLARAERSHTALLAEAHSYLDSLKGGA